MPRESSVTKTVNSRVFLFDNLYYLMVGFVYHASALGKGSISEMKEVVVTVSKRLFSI